MKEEQKYIYFASGETVERIDSLPQTEMVKEKGYEVLYFTDEIDEFAIQMLMEYDGKHFANICKDEVNLSTDEEKKEIEEKNESSKDLLEKIKGILADKVSSVKFSNKLGSHPVSISAEGYVSLEMEKVLSQMPGANQGVKAQLVLEINSNHPVAQKLEAADDDTLKKYVTLLYSSARLVAGLDIENPTEFSDMLADMIQ